jgi:hypothetical protein
MDEIKQIALKLKKLEDCGELRIVYSNAIGSNAMVMVNTEKFVIVINPSLSYEQQIREIWHEAKHICSHLNNKNCSVAYAEYDADRFVDRIISKPEFLDELRGIINF